MLAYAVLVCTALNFSMMTFALRHLNASTAMVIPPPPTSSIRATPGRSVRGCTQGGIEDGCRRGRPLGMTPSCPFLPPQMYDLAEPVGTILTSWVCGPRTLPPPPPHARRLLASTLSLAQPA